MWRAWAAGSTAPRRSLRGSRSRFVWCTFVINQGGYYSMHVGLNVCTIIFIMHSVAYSAVARPQNVGANHPQNHQRSIRRLTVIRRITSVVYGDWLSFLESPVQYTQIGFHSKNHQRSIRRLIVMCREGRAGPYKPWRGSSDHQRSIRRLAVMCREGRAGPYKPFSKTFLQQWQ